jgi:phosphoglycerate dehydrogenase-like enzyme
MKNVRRLIIATLAIVSGSPALYAQLSIEQLVEQARIVENDVAVSELPRWNGAHKILIWDIGMDLSGLTDGAPGVEFVLAESVEEALQHASDVDAMIGFCAPELIDAAKNLVWVQIYWAGVERCLSVEDLANGTVILSNMQKMSSPVIAEHVIAMMLSLARNLPQFVSRMDSGDWADSRSNADGMRSVAGKKLLVAGLGGIGTEVARLGAALGMNVSGTRTSSRSGPDYVEYVGLSHELLALAAEADVVINALPLTDGTSGLMDEEFFAAIKPGAIFVNVGRGKTVVTDALIAALESGAVSGAGLDVTDPEPLPSDSALWTRDDVIITPHVASAGGERERHAVLLRENLRRYVAGERLLNVVDPKKGY